MILIGIVSCTICQKEPWSLFSIALQTLFLHKTTSNKSFSDKCHLCKNRDSTLHCLNGCKVALNQGRYTWRHNNILQYIVNCVDTSRFSVYSDLPGYQTSNGGSLLPSLIVTTLKPDVVIVDNVKKEVVIYELTSPFQKNIHTQHKYKCDKYAHFETSMGYLLSILTVPQLFKFYVYPLLRDANKVYYIKSHKTTVVAFEVGARGGLTDQNITRLTNMHKQHLHRHIKKKHFIQNIKVLATLSSYYIYTARKHPSWEHTAPINPPF